MHFKPLVSASFLWVFLQAFYVIPFFGTAHLNSIFMNVGKMNGPIIRVDLESWNCRENATYYEN